ncbi:hypothetical protein BJ970_002214 [Saccharopolyspora phatthalungensis]|uniref:Uncharacterized protein n=1 Tax=Saccharopolyspora phatthalungensis TaxID=664693 RepID=A0A840Q449_9PSEU|nr:hypothetical protein [Saccharopolyspora phatthalungensis]
MTAKQGTPAISVEINVLISLEIAIPETGGRQHTAERCWR